MSLTPSDKIALGSIAPNFNLHDTISNKQLSLQDCKGEKGTLVLFICNHCPFVIHINPTLIALAKEYQTKGISFVGISSNDAVNYPMDGPERMKKHAGQEGYTFPYLYDETQEVAKAYGATCTPDIFLYNTDLQLEYHGQLDSSRPGNGLVCDGADLRNSFENLLNNKPTENQFPSVGCNIKWK